jgi:hypothetical protein
MFKPGAAYIAAPGFPPARSTRPPLSEFLFQMLLPQPHYKHISGLPVIFA